MQIVLDLKLALQSYTGKTSSLTNLQKQVLRRCYDTIYIIRSTLYPNNPRRDADYNSRSDFSGCGTCAKKVIAQLSGWYIQHKHIITKT